MRVAASSMAGVSTVGCTITGSGAAWTTMPVLFMVSTEAAALAQEVASAGSSALASRRLSCTTRAGITGTSVVRATWARVVRREPAMVWVGSMMMEATITTSHTAASFLAAKATIDTSLA
jgi:hypothetical protein